MGRFLHKAPCPECGSKDNVIVYTDGASCMTPGCGYWSKDGDGLEAVPTFRRAKEVEGVIAAIPERRISEATCRKYNVTVTFDPQGKIDRVLYPYCDRTTNEHVATKTRVGGPRSKDMPWSGDTSNTGLFGRQTCRPGGKYITITEGEHDTLAVSEIFGNKYDVVSLRNGARGAKEDIQNDLELLETYENIVVCFDSDEEGKKAVEAVKDLFSPNKLKVVGLRSGKDAGEYLESKKVKLFTEEWWAAKAYQPQGIVAINETWDAVLKYRDTPSVPYPFPSLNDILLGQRTQEIVVWGAPTGVGKTQMMREVMHGLITNTNDRVACLMLEESVAKTTLGWMSFYAQKPLHKCLDTVSQEELRKYWEMAVKDNRISLLDHQGWRNELEVLKARIRYQAKALGCKWVALDHLHIALSSVAGASGDWSGIDELMTELRSLVHECDIGMHLVSHTSGDRSLRGSKGIAQLADAVIFLERDKHHDDPDMRNMTKVVVDKNRFAGDTGSFWIRYDSSTTRLHECAAPDTDLRVHEEF